MNNPNNTSNGAGKPNPNRNNRPPGANFKNNRRRYKGHQNKNRPQGPQGTPSSQNSTERFVEKYINLLDQHLIARRKYHDLFYRAEGSQKAKLERNFFNTIIELREFENRLPPEIKDAFEKRINGLRPDTTYSLNHNIDLENIPLPIIDDKEIADPHFLQSQKISDFSNDTEESMGSIEDYNKYKNI